MKLHNDIQVETPQGSKNWLFVKKCIENHDDLITALDSLLEMITDNRLHGDEIFKASETLSKARGKL